MVTYSERGLNYHLEKVIRVILTLLEKKLFTFQDKIYGEKVENLPLVHRVIIGILIRDQTNEIQNKGKPFVPHHI